MCLFLIKPQSADFSHLNGDRFRGKYVYVSVIYYKCCQSLQY